MIKIYTCGPTIYRPLHIGNLYTLVYADAIRRILELQDFSVEFALNLTDIDDKILHYCREKNESYFLKIMREKENTLKLLQYLEILRPDDLVPITTNYIPEINYLISQIPHYLTEHSVVASIDFNQYFSLGKSSTQGREILVDTNKINKEDFVLWKKTEEYPSWISSFGIGRPGWHIECVAKMIDMLKLNNNSPLDYQIGGIDLKFPHHENTIYLLKTLGITVKNVIHINSLKNHGKKMSKSLQNEIFFEHDPKIFRLMCLRQSFKKDFNLQNNSYEDTKIFYQKLISVLTVKKYIKTDKKYFFFLKNFNIPGILGLILSGQVSQEDTEKFFYRFSFL